jgi:hypothetical protein
MSAASEIPALIIRARVSASRKASNLLRPLALEREGWRARGFRFGISDAPLDENQNEAVCPWLRAFS